MDGNGISSLSLCLMSKYLLGVNQCKSRPRRNGRRGMLLPPDLAEGNLCSTVRVHDGDTFDAMA